MGAGEFGLDVGWSEFEDFDVAVAELIAEGLRPGVDGGFCGAVGREWGERKEGQTRGDGHDGGFGLGP